MILGRSLAPCLRLGVGLLAPPLRLVVALLDSGLGGVGLLIGLSAQLHGALHVQSAAARRRRASSRSSESRSTVPATARAVASTRSTASLAAEPAPVRLPGRSLVAASSGHARDLQVTIYGCCADDSLCLLWVDACRSLLSLARGAVELDRFFGGRQPGLLSGALGALGRFVLGLPLTLSFGVLLTGLGRRRDARPPCGPARPAAHAAARRPRSEAVRARSRSRCVPARARPAPLADALATASLRACSSVSDWAPWSRPSRTRSSRPVAEPTASFALPRTLPTTPPAVLSDSCLTTLSPYSC